MPSTARSGGQRATRKRFGRYGRACLLAACLGLSVAAAEPRVEWRSPDAVRLLDALTALSATTGLRIVHPQGSDVLETLPAPDVPDGHYTTDELLERLLEGSGLGWRIDEQGDVLIAPRQQLRAPAVLVTAAPLLEEAPVRVGASAAEMPGTTPWHAEQLGDWPTLDWQQLLRYAPNVSGQGATLNLRGVGLGRGAATAASVYVDGMPVPLSVIDADAVPMLGLESIEFRRGPRSPWEGASTLGGSIDLGTRQPATERRLHAGASLGTADDLRAFAEIESGIGAHGLGARLGVESRRNDGFHDHAERGQRGIDGQHLRSALLKVSWEPDQWEALSARVRLLGIEGDPGQPLIAPSSQGQEGFDPFDRLSFDPFDYRRRLDSGAGALDIEWRGSERWQAWLHLAYGEASERSDLTLAALPSERQRSRDRESRGLASTGIAVLPGGGWRLALAAELQRRRFDSAEASLSDVRDFFPPALEVDVDPSSDRIIEGRVVTRITSSSLALDARRDSGPWTFEAGLRLLDERLAQHQSLDSFLDPGGCTIRIGDILIDCEDEFPERGLREESRSSNVVRLPHGRLEWRPSENHRIGIGYRRGYLSGGTQFNVVSGGFDAYAPERSSTIDLAWRWQHPRFESTLTLFANRWRDRQVPIALPQAGSFIIGNAGRATARGAEWVVRGAVADHWRWHAGVGHLDTRFDRFSLTDGFDIVDLAGRRFPEAPRHTAVAGLSWRGANGLHAGLGLRYSSAVFSDPANRAQGHRGGHAVLDAVVGWRGERLHAFLAIDNLADRDYLRALQLVAGQPNPRFYRPGAPRTLRLGVQFDW